MKRSWAGGWGLKQRGEFEPDETVYLTRRRGDAEKAEGRGLAPPAFREDYDMPKLSVEDNSRIFLRIRAKDKALLLRAAALNHTSLTDFVIRHALRAAKAVVDEADRVQLSARDSLRVLDVLENPRAPNARLLAAARAL
jgi:uncharacterized protein (DUF1778 family)